MEPPSPIPTALIDAIRRKSEEDVSALRNIRIVYIDKTALALRLPALLPQKPITLTNTEAEDL